MAMNFKNSLKIIIFHTTALVNCNFLPNKNKQTSKTTIRLSFKDL